MIILGLAGQARAGKDTVANHLVRRYGFVKFAFSDSLYDEVQEAFGLEDQSLLRDRATKDTPSERLALVNCQSDEFIGTAVQIVPHESRHLHEHPLTPRQILQWWGAEYRRTQDPEYWVKMAEGRVEGAARFGYPEQRRQHFVECGTRFENEREWIKGPHYPRGNIWHIHRDATDKFDDSHVSAAPLPVLEGERELWNNDTIERLHQGIDLLMSTSARFVRVEPMGASRPPEAEFTGYLDETFAGYYTDTA